MNQRENEVKTSILVRDVMTVPVVSVYENENLETVAKLMDKEELGSIIVTDKENRPLGLITERDIVARVTSRNLLPNKVKAKEVMSGPLKIISPNADIKNAAEQMRIQNVRRLVVIEKGKMIGIISSKDIVEITPSLIEIIVEKAKIKLTPLLLAGTEAAGTCEQCDQWSDMLQQFEGRFLCDECRIEVEAEER
ncbi:CBS domain-containing protein [Candidatus Bathyarchaeota archaeon]|nr:CBS domain-containing protein [Candidatus Bathyarchaeota archaeon]